MKAEQVMEEEDHKAQTRDIWKHAIERPVTPTEADDRPIITYECDRWGHRCPAGCGRIGSHVPPQIVSNSQ